MTLIRLNAPQPMSPRLERLRLIPGRHLGEDELERMQAYTDARLEHLLAGARPGILRGLEVDLPPARPGAPVGEGCVVRPGLAVNGGGTVVGLFYESRATWDALIGDWLRENRGDDAEGVYYLVLRRGRGLIDADIGLDPCRRAEPDPRRDTRIEMLGTLALRRLALNPTAAAALTPQRVQNQVAALHVDGAFLEALEGAVPLALLAVAARAPAAEDVPPFQVAWVSQTAGRYLAIAGRGLSGALRAGPGGLSGGGRCGPGRTRPSRGPGRDLGRTGRRVPGIRPAAGLPARCRRPADPVARAARRPHAPAALAAAPSGGGHGGGARGGRPRAHRAASAAAGDRPASAPG